MVYYTRRRSCRSRGLGEQGLPHQCGSGWGSREPHEPAFLPQKRCESASFHQGPSLFHGSDGDSPLQPCAHNIEEEAGFAETPSATFRWDWPVGSEVSRVVCTGWGPTYFTSTESTQKQLATPKLEAHRVLSQTKGTKKCLQNNFTFRFIWILHTFDWTSYIIHFYFQSILNGKDHSKTKLKSCFLKMSKRKDLSIPRWNIPTMLKLNSWHFEALPIFFSAVKTELTPNWWDLPLTLNLLAKIPSIKGKT